MTLSVSWVRMIGDVHELVFASDSRLSGGGMKFDSCPKMLDLPRSDCIISFAGATEYAYPLMIQMANAINFYPASRSRRVDILDAKGIIVQVFNEMRNSISDHYLGTEGPGDPGALFIFGGYSWKLQEFKIWTLHYDRKIDRFTFRPSKPWGGQDVKMSQGRFKSISWIGDKPAIDEAKMRLVEILERRGSLRSGGFDMEPLEVLRDIIRSRRYDSVGGAPQVAKVYRSMQTQHFAVRWPNSDGSPHAAGRPALEFEKFDLPVIDIEVPHIHSRKSLQMHLTNDSVSD